MEPTPIFPTKAITVAWIGLMVATAIGWLCGGIVRDGHGSAKLAVAGVIVTAFIKIWIIGYQFMELRSAP